MGGGWKGMSGFWAPEFSWVWQLAEIRAVERTAVGVYKPLLCAPVLGKRFFPALSTISSARLLGCAPWMWEFVSGKMRGSRGALRPTAEVLGSPPPQPYGIERIRWKERDRAAFPL